MDQMGGGSSSSFTFTREGLSVGLPAYTAVGTVGTHLAGFDSGGLK